MKCSLPYHVEPGYYEDGVFGVRIENVELIKEIKTKYDSGIVNLTMEPLTLVCD
jgi:Xaa-Pro aminopeptidase